MHTTIEHVHSIKLWTFLFVSSSAAEAPTTQLNEGVNLYNADGSQKFFEIFSVQKGYYHHKEKRPVSARIHIE